MDLKRSLEIFSLAVGAILVLQTIRRNEDKRVVEHDIIYNVPIAAPRTAYHSRYAKLLRGDYI